MISRRTCELRVFAAAWRTSGLMTSVDWKNKYLYNDLFVVTELVVKTIYSCRTYIHGCFVALMEEY